jgi:2-hydroxy-6-oxonona-2,4-dienedioate hydrolase
MNPAGVEADAEAQRAFARLEASGTRHRVTEAGSTICWRQFGQGRPLVLLHGGYGSWLHWVRNIEALARRHSLWVADLPGAGDSESLPGPVDAPDALDRLSDVLQGSLDQLLGAQERHAIAGFSFGALVAAKLASRSAGVERLALLGVASHGGTRRMPEELRPWRFDNPERRRAALRHNLQLLMLHGPHADDALALAVHQAACEKSRFRSKPLSRAALLPPLLERIACPILFAWGEHDVTAVPREIGARFVRGRPEREWVVLPGAGHWVQYEDADASNTLLQRWFA